mmetsp:Transcript_101952/g.264072  ORF Transcript_101952/g.264072 Transcript_101952/m.264072 type:complete len:91 (+) Transcript_101952:1206-1478(+)
MSFTPSAVFCDSVFGMQGVVTARKADGGLAAGAVDVFACSLALLGSRRLDATCTEAWSSIHNPMPAPPVCRAASIERLVPWVHPLIFNAR